MPLTLASVTKGYRSRPVLDRLDLEVGDGDRVAIMGPSGSGKTTLLSILGLLIEPDAGEVLIDGAPAPRREYRRHLIRSRTFGWVLQTMNVASRRSALDNVAIPLLAAGHSRVEAGDHAIAALARVGLEDRAETPVRFLSGGEVQRVCIARALAHRPRYLLADEPTGQLDHTTSLTVLHALSDLLDATAATLVVATHDPDVAAACNTVFDLVDGKAIPR